VNPWHRELAERFGTPCYVYDAEELGARAQELRSLLPDEAWPRLLYSFKCNPNPAVAGELRRHGCEADLTSPGELAAAEAAGFDLSRALYGGPGKGEEELVGALARGVRRFSVESWHDLEVLARAARSLGVRARALLRVNPAEAPRAKLAMTGVASQFGFEEADLRDGAAEHFAAAAGAVAVEGVHIYWGTQIGGPEPLLECFRAAVTTAERLSADLGFPLRVLNLGGGFPWPYASRGRGTDLEALRAGLAELHANAGAAREAEWWFESGRFLAASSGTLVARVMDVKQSKDKRFLILDTGIHHLGGMTGLGRIPRFSIDFDTEVPSAEAGAEFEVVGQLCTPLDCLAKRTALPELRPGDFVSVPNVGAYGVTGSLVAFLSRPAPAEILYCGREVLSVARLRGGHESILHSKTHSPSTSAPLCPCP